MTSVAKVCVGWYGQWLLVQRVRWKQATKKFLVQVKRYPQAHEKRRLLISAKEELFRFDNPDKTLCIQPALQSNQWHRLSSC
jgi:hypothetical protein